jgi:hypothetical protein
MARKETWKDEPGGRVNESADRESVLDWLRTAVEGIRYGEVRVIIQDGVIVQIERVEKQRFR